MTDSDPRRTENVNVPPRRRSPLLVLLVAALAALVIALSLGLLRGQENAGTSSPIPAATATSTATATPTAVAVTTTPPPVASACPNAYQAGDGPIVAPRRSGQHLEVALDAVRPGPNGGNRWFVRFFVPAGAPGPAEIPLRASVTGPAGSLQSGAYEAGPPNAGAGPVTQPLTLQPCLASATPGTRGTVVIGVETAAVRSGTYTLTWSDIRLPEGGTRTESWTVTLTCQVSGGPATPPATLCR